MKNKVIKNAMELSFQHFGHIMPDVQDPRRRQERRDYNMMNTDRSAIANLPTREQHHEFTDPHVGKYGGYFTVLLD